MKNEKISVIVPIYNVEKYLVRCIKSIINQTYKNIEIILVDDGSSDNCPVICNNFAKKDKRILVTHQKNGGVSSARNAGISLASGEYITFVDADDSIEQNMIKLLYETLISSKSDVSICNILYLEEGQYPVDANNKNLTQTLSGSDALNSMLYQKDITNGPFAKLYKRRLFVEIRFQEGITVAEDLDVNYRILLKAKRITVNSSQKYYYLKRQGSAMQSLFNNRRMDGLSVTKRIIEDTTNYNNRFIKSSENRYFMEAIYILVIIPIDVRLFIEEKNICKNVIKRYRKTIIKDSSSRLMPRVYAVVSYFGYNNITTLFRLKSHIKYLIGKIR